MGSSSRKKQKWQGVVVVAQQLSQDTNLCAPRQQKTIIHQIDDIIDIIKRDWNKLDRLSTVYQDRCRESTLSKGTGINWTDLVPSTQIEVETR